MAKEALKPLYYLYGSEDYLVERELERIVNGALEGGLGDMNHHVFDAGSLDPEEVVSVAMTLPAFSSKRVIVVKGAESLKARQEKVFMEYAADPSPTTVMVFVSGAAKKKDSGFFRFLEKKGFVKAFNRLKEENLVEWIKNEVRSQGKTISADAARKLLAIAGKSLRDLKGEIEKLLLFTGQKKSIDAKDVEDCGLDMKEETLFALSDAMGSRDLAKAMKILAKVENEPPLKMLGAMARQIRVLLKLKVLLRKGKAPGGLARLVGVPHFRLNDYIRRSRAFGEEELVEALKKLYSADTDLKTGRLPQHLVISKLLIELCSSGKARAGRRTREGAWR